MQQGLVAFAAVLATSAACSQSAFGWTASATAGTLAVQAAPGEANLLAVSDGDPGTFVVTDDGAAFVGPAPAGCTALDDGEGHLFGVQCDAAALPRVTIDAADGADVIDALAVTVVVTAAGGDGNDTLTGGDRAEQLDGGAGDDAVDGGAGGDTVLGGAGADELFGSGGDDAVDGGAGNDRLDGGDGADRASGADGDDVVDGGTTTAPSCCARTTRSTGRPRGCCGKCSAGSGSTTRGSSMFGPTSKAHRPTAVALTAPLRRFTPSR